MPFSRNLTLITTNFIVKKSNQKIAIMNYSVQNAALGIYSGKSMHLTKPPETVMEN